MWPFVDPATKKKVRFSSVDEGALVGAGEVDKGQLLRECGGELDVSHRASHAPNCLRWKLNQGEGETMSLWEVILTTDAISSRNILERAHRNLRFEAERAG